MLHSPSRLADACRRVLDHKRAWVTVILCWTVISSAACSRQSNLPGAITDREFASLIEGLSETAGTFTVSDNFVSNEPHFAENIRRMRPMGGVYIGVGPEQNFSYIAGLRPELAFIIDIRRENRNLHLLYKELFELSIDRADFVSHLFSRPRPADLASTASVEEIFSRFEHVPASPEQYRANAALVRQRIRKRALPVSQIDFDSIDRVFKAFYDDGPAIQFWGSRAVGADALRPSYRQLMTARDAHGRTRSFLSSDEAFRFVKDVHSRNLIVPVIGDFGGPSAIRRVGDYVRSHASVIRAFYGSNVAVYLNNQQSQAFCGNLATLPMAARSWFIENDRVRLLTAKLNACSPEAK